MRRAVQQSNKPVVDLEEIVQPEQYKSSTIVSKKKLKKVKNLTKGNPLCTLKETNSKHETSRTRSVSPASPQPPPPPPPFIEATLPYDKFYKIYSKIVNQMEMVKDFTTSKINETENLVDLRRQLQRADEFSIRFSRNNIYETKRIINDIKKLFVPYPYEKPEQYITLFKKIILAFQSASQALQSYINYVQNPCNLEVPDKINELIVIIADLILCCEQISISPDNIHIKNDAFKICNELLVLFKSRIPICEYVEFKEEDLRKKRGKTVVEEMEKTKKFSMYKPKLVPRLKPEIPKKKTLNCFLGAKAIKPRKNDKTAMITHEIYTQKMNPWEIAGLNGNKIVKFKQNEEKVENPPDKKTSLRRRYGTPREVRSQDDDVETVVQTIGDDETVSKIDSTPREPEEKKDFKEYLLQALEELKTGDKTDQKLTLDKLLDCIQNFSKPPNPDRVKFYHFVSEDLAKEIETKEHEPEILDKNEEKEKKEAAPEKDVLRDISPKGRRRRTQLFKPLRPNNGDVEVGSRGKVKLKLSEEVMTNANKYRKDFAEYRKNNIMYKKTYTYTPWELVGKISDRIIFDLIKEISEDFQNDTMLRGLYLSELLEVTS